MCLSRTHMHDHPLVIDDCVRPTLLKSEAPIRPSSKHIVRSTPLPSIIKLITPGLVSVLEAIVSVKSQVTKKCYKAPKPPPARLPRPTLEHSHSCLSVRREVSSSASSPVAIPLLVVRTRKLWRRRSRRRRLRSPSAAPPSGMTDARRRCSSR